jgi:hypothetical protein
MLRGSNVWERNDQIETVFINKLRAELNRGILATIRIRICCIHVCCQNIKRLKLEKLFFRAALHRSETWSLPFRQGHRLKTFENRALRRVFGSRRMSNRRLETTAYKGA